MMYTLNQLLSRPAVQKKFVALLHNPHTISTMVRLLIRIGRLEATLPLREKLSQVKAGTIAVLTSQIREILTTEFEIGPEKHDTPCYFAMSIYDPLIRFDSTIDILHRHFANVNSVKLHYPYHQPPTPFTFEDLNRDFGVTVNSFLRTASGERISRPASASSGFNPLNQHSMANLITTIPYNGSVP